MFYDSYLYCQSWVCLATLKYLLWMTEQLEARAPESVAQQTLLHSCCLTSVSLPYKIKKGTFLLSSVLTVFHSQTVEYSLLFEQSSATQACFSCLGLGFILSSSFCWLTSYFSFVVVLLGCCGEGDTEVSCWGFWSSLSFTGLLPWHPK